MTTTTAVPNTGFNSIDSELTGMKWGGAVGTGVTVTYSFATKGSDYGSSNALANANFHAFDAVQQAAARQAMTYWSEVANIKFVEVADSRDSHGTIRFGRSNGPADDPLTTAKAFFPNTDENAGDVWLGNGLHPDTQTNYAQGTYFFHALLHEIGHAIGLKHPQDAVGGGVTAPPGEDWLGTSVMTYRSYPGDPLSGTGYSNDRYPSRPMLNDIDAIQHIYGANPTFHNGNDTYSWAPGQKIFETIWDSGGIDTLDWSNQTTAATISLVPGTFSSLGPAYTWTAHGGGHLDTTLAIGHFTFIENANGGSAGDLIQGGFGFNTLHGNGGNDLLFGLDSADNVFGDAGNDVVSGDSSDDTLVGGTGSDTLYGGDGNDGMSGGDGINPSSDTSSNVLYGGRGDDSLDGNAGNDMLSGGDGADFLIGRGGFDTADYSEENAGVTVDLATSLAITATGHDNVIGIEAVVGSRFGDFLIGDGGNNIVQGLAGGDVLDGAGGIDTLDYGRSSASVFVDLASGEAFGGDAQGDTIKNFENVQGSQHDDILSGTAGVNRFVGAGGADIIFGGGGDDVVAGGAGADELHGGDGVDTLDYSSSAAGVSVSLAIGGQVAGGDAAGDIIAFFENVVGSAHDDSLKGDTSANRLVAGGGGDSLVGGLGHDDLTGGSGADRFSFTNMAESGRTAATRDAVHDFHHGESDHLVLAFDGDANRPGSQVLRFIGTQAFTAADQARFFFEGDHTVVEVNTIGTSGAEMQIRLDGHLSLIAGDFLFA